MQHAKSTLQSNSHYTYHRHRHREINRIITRKCFKVQLEEESSQIGCSKWLAKKELFLIPLKQSVLLAVSSKGFQSIWSNDPQTINSFEGKRISNHYSMRKPKINTKQKKIHIVLLLSSIHIVDQQLNSHWNSKTTIVGKYWQNPGAATDQWQKKRVVCK